jgi:hypothetical protein
MGMEGEMFLGWSCKSPLDAFQLFTLVDVIEFQMPGEYDNRVLSEVK